MRKRKPQAPKSMGPALDAESFIEVFADVSDPRSGAVEHPLMSILLICLCGTIAGASGPTMFEVFAKTNEEFMSRLVPLPNGVPSHDTISRVLGLLNPDQLEKAFSEWMASVVERCAGDVVAIDGKTLRRARNMRDGTDFVHMVSAWSTANGVVLGQVKTDDKSNEITAIPELLRLLDIKGCIVTTDAMGAQKGIAAQIREQGGDYLLQIKENHPKLAEAIATHFSSIEGDESAPQGVSFAETNNKGHGRREVRRCWTSPVPRTFEGRDEWQDIATLIHIQSERHIDGKVSLADRWFISSRADFDAGDALDAARSHWHIENRLHWTLDVVFGEDQARDRANNAAENLVVIRHLALNFLRSAKNVKGGVASKRKMAGWDTRVLAKILGVSESLSPRND